MSRIPILALTLVFSFLAANLSCDRGGHILMVGSISGPGDIPEGTTVEYSVDAESDSRFTYNWEVNPVGYGTLGSPAAASTTFTAPEVDSDFKIVIRVVVNFDDDGPVVRSIDVTVKNIPDLQDYQPPSAGAHSSLTVVEPEVEIQFTDDSTDPDGNDDIVKWEWDFSFNPDEGFQPEDDNQNPIHAYDIEGHYLIHLMVTDSGGLTDMLDVPLEITVATPSAHPLAAAHADKYNISSCDNIQFYDDSTDPDGSDDIIKWEWDFSYETDDGFIIESTEREPYVTFPHAGVFHIQLRVTDSTGLTDTLGEPFHIEVNHEIVYAFTLGSKDDPENNFELNDIGVDDSNYIYLEGRFEYGCIDFDPTYNQYLLWSYYITGDAFLVQYEPSFNVRWGKKIEYVVVEDLQVGASGITCITGDLCYNGTGKDGTFIRIYDQDSATLKSINILDNYEWDSFGSGYNIIRDKYEISPSAINQAGQVYYIKYEYHSVEHWVQDEFNWWIHYLAGVYLDVYSTLYKQGSPISPIHDLNWIHEFNSVGVNKNGYILVLDDVENGIQPAIAHYDWDGNLLWHYNRNFTLDHGYFTIKSDQVGNIYIYEPYYQIIEKLSPDGDSIWEFNLPTNVSDFYIEDDGAFIIAGSFTDTVDFDPGPGEVLRDSNGVTAGYVCAFDRDGNFEWVETWGYTEFMSISGVTMDGFGNIYVCGNFKGSIDLGSSCQPDIHYTLGGYNGFVMEFSP